MEEDMWGGGDASGIGVVYHLRRQRYGNCARVAVFIGFLVGLEMCVLQFTKIAVENCSKQVRTSLEIVGILLMLLCVLFMVLVSISDSQCVLQMRPPIQPLLADEEDGGEADADR